MMDQQTAHCCSDKQSYGDDGASGNRDYVNVNVR